MKELFKTIISVTMSVVVASSCIGNLAFVEASADTLGSSYEQSLKDNDDICYWDLLEQYENSGLKDYVGNDLELSFKPSQTITRQTYDGVEAIQWNSDTSTIEWQVRVSEEALYNIEVDYYLFNDTVTDKSVHTL